MLKCVVDHFLVDVMVLHAAMSNGRHHYRL